MVMETGPAWAEEPPRGRAYTHGIVEKTCLLFSGLALMVLLALVAVDIVTRWAFNFSFEVSDEVGAYMLVAITFLSLPVSHINGAFHRVEFIQARLSRRARLISRLVFDLLALLVCAIFVWQFIGLVRSSWRFGDHAPTFLETPLWIPRSLLLIGMAALCLSLIRSLAADLRRLWASESAKRARDES
jgi:TRAP-type C4-dicarboxylate transport system permease small subunit